MIQPASIAEAVEAVRACPRLLPHGGRTKPATSRPPDPETAALDLRGLRGMVEYEPTEFLFTALAGTPVQEVGDILAAHGQYLPFDPPLARAGATLGGTVAAAMSGAGRLRFGGVRDFLCAIRWIDGAGNLVRGGARVVKNAAGFDFPKLFTGSMGRLGAMVELSFKVFPSPPGRMTLEVTCEDIGRAIDRMALLCGQPWEVEALECLPPADGGPVRLMARFMGNPDVLPARVRAIAEAVDDPARIPDPEEADAFWSEAGEFGDAADGGLVKVPLTPAAVAPLLAALTALPARPNVRISMAGNLALISGPDDAMDGPLDRVLEGEKLPGMRLRGAGSLRPGLRALPEAERRIRAALDPGGRFPPLL